MDLNLGDTKLIIAECQKEGLLRNQCAYVLATAYHESAHTMKPISEMGSQSYLRSRKYWPYIGRGYVQLTWDYNYQKAGAKLGVDFMAHPEWLLQSQYAVPILVEGMKEGWFTGKKLSDYIDLNHSDFVDARREINGMDRASLIAGYAQTYDDLLKSLGYGDVQIPTAPAIVVNPPVATPVPVQVPTPVTPTAPAAKLNLVDIIVLIFRAIFGGGVK